MPSLSPEQIEKFRQSGIRLDRSGRFWHEGVEITHPRFILALRRWLDTLADGRTIVRLDATRYAYVELEDAHLLVTSVRWRDGTAMISLNDETSEELCYESLEQSSDNALYCSVRNGKLTARFATQAYYQLAEHIEAVASDAGQETFALVANGRRYSIATRISSAGC